jgi:ketosteroid isomerase-like protein
MTTLEIAKAFTAMLQEGDHKGAAEKFNAPNIVSIEPMDGPMARVEGTDAVALKSQWWYANHEVHEVNAEGPFVNGDQFMVLFDMDITPKATGERMESSEIGLYTVKDGKIVEERFYYDQSEDEDEDEEGVDRQG